jgi:uncharacterized protein YkwD
VGGHGADDPTVVIDRGRMRTRRLGLHALALLAATAACSSPAAAAEVTCAHASVAPRHLSTPAASHALRCLVNRVRRRHGLRPVRAERHLRRAARRHAVDMAAHDFFGHVSPTGATMTTRIDRSGYLRDAGDWCLGEALAWGREDAGAPAAILGMLMASPPHRAILLDPRFRDLGIGVARGAPQGIGTGALTITLDFGGRVGR